VRRRVLHVMEALTQSVRNVASGEHGENVRRKTELRTESTEN